MFDFSVLKAGTEGSRDQGAAEGTAFSYQLEFATAELGISDWSLVADAGI
jgi:hypothetical protein